MSAIPVVPGSVAPERPRTGRPLRAVPDAPLAEVRDIRSAPSVRRRRSALAAEDPSSRRRPLPPRVVPAGDGRRAVGARMATGARRALALVVLGAAGLGLGVGAGLLAQPDPYSGPTALHSVVAGDSVWGLAAAVDSDRPLEQVVLDIEQLNDLRGALQPGQLVELPTR